MNSVNKLFGLTAVLLLSGCESPKTENYAEFQLRAKAADEVRAKERTELEARAYQAAFDWELLTEEERRGKRNPREQFSFGRGGAAVWRGELDGQREALKRQRKKFVEDNPSTLDQKKQLILAGRYAIGFSAAEVRAAIGEPQRTTRSTTALGVGETWIYRGGLEMLHFENGRLTSFQEFNH